MPLLPNAGIAVVDPAKITHYLLSATHPVGAPQAAFFKTFGFSADQPQVLADALLKHAKTFEAMTLPATVHGTEYEISGPLASPDGRMPRVRSVWIIDAGQSIPRFVTAVPD